MRDTVVNTRSGIVSGLLVAVVLSGSVRAQLTSPGYATTTLSLSPTHYYRLNETTPNTTSPSVVDNGTAALPGIHVGTFGTGNAEVGAGGVWLPGFERQNKAILHVEKGVVNLGPGTNFAADTMTVSLWFKAKAPTDQEFNGGFYAERLFQNNQPDSGSPLQIAAWYHPTDTIKRGLALATANGQSCVVREPDALYDGQWHQVVAVRRGSSIANAELYVDGVLKTVGPTNDGWGISGSTAWLGSRDATNLAVFSGATDELAVWLDRALTAAEVASLYRSARTSPTLPSYASAVLGLNPIGYYRFSEPAGLTAGETVVNWANQGTTSSGLLADAVAGLGKTADAGTVPTFNSVGPRSGDSIKGRSLGGLEPDNTAVQFRADGGNDVTPDTAINLGANPSLMSGEQLTYSLLFKTTSNDAWMRMVTTDANSPNDFLLILDQGKIALILDADNGSGMSVSTGTTTANQYSDGQWHHLVAMRNGDAWDSARLYMDGAPVALSNRSGGVWGVGTSALIGARGDNLYGFTGLLDEVAIWNRTLSATEALALYEALTVPEPSALALLAIGGLWLAGRRLRQKRNRHNWRSEPGLPTGPASRLAGRNRPSTSPARIHCSIPCRRTGSFSVSVPARAISSSKTLQNHWDVIRLPLPSQDVLTAAQGTPQAAPAGHEAASRRD
jgi:hypothetical protein